MSTPEQPARSAATFEAGSLHVSRLPDENLATLSRIEFKVLLDGEVHEAKAGRDLCMGFFVSAAIGLVGLVATIDWQAAFHETRWAPFGWTALLLVICVSSACGWLIYYQRYKRTRTESAYSDLMKRLATHFKENSPG